MSFLPLPPNFEGLDDRTLASHQITKEEKGGYFCAMCWKHPSDLNQVLVHLKANDHQTRVKNAKFEADPLSSVPLEHQQFTHLKNGWPVCKICDKRMEETHWQSPSHKKWVEYYVQQQTALGSVGSVPLDVRDTRSRLSQPLDTTPPLPQPPPPPGPPPSKCCFPSSKCGSSSSQPPPPSGLPPSTRGGDVLSAGSVAPGTTSLPSRSLSPGFCSSVSASGGAGMCGAEYACGSRNDDKWIQTVRQFDERVPVQWFPDDFKWCFVGL